MKFTFPFKRNKKDKTGKEVIVKQPKPKEKKFSWKMKKWFFGVTKEFRRTSWGDKRTVAKDFVIIVIIVLVLAAIFLGLDMLLKLAHII